MTLRKKSKISKDFNMSSMTDIIFLLLIFFVLTSSVVREPVMKILLPKGVKSNVVTQIIKVYVSEDHQYMIEDKNTSIVNLPTDLQRELNNNPGATVSVHGDKRVEYEKVMELVKIADGLGAKVVLALERGTVN
jgi:biopolymer transport protein ExbD